MGFKSKNKGSKLGSNLGPLTAENHIFGPRITHHRPKRINNLAHPLLFRDQGVGGSNPLSPTIKINNFQTKIRTSLHLFWCWGARWGANCFCLKQHLALVPVLLLLVHIGSFLVSVHDEIDDR